MNQATPGPWFAMVCEGGVTVRTAGSRLILADVRHPGKVLTNNHREQIANAQLMAEAPRMLEALTALLASYYDKQAGPSIVPYFCAGKDSEVHAQWVAAREAVEAALLPFADPSPGPKGRPTQLFYQESAKIGGLNALMSEMVANGDITNAELAALIEKRRAVYGRFAGFVGTLPK